MWRIFLIQRSIHTRFNCSRPYPIGEAFPHVLHECALPFREYGDSHPILVMAERAFQRRCFHTIRDRMALCAWNLWDPTHPTIRAPGSLM